MREPPYDLDSEQAVIGCIMLAPESLDEIQPILQAEDFHANNHQQIYAAALELRSEGKPTDAVAIASHLGKEIASVGGVATLAQFMEFPGATSNDAYYAGIVARMSLRRKFIETCRRASQEAFDGKDTLDLVSDTENRLHALLERQAGNEPVHIKDVFEEAIAQMDSQSPPGIAMGWEELDKLYQLQKGDVIYIAARPSMGKTAFGLNLAINVAKRGQEALFFTLEQTKLDFADRVLSSISGVAMHKIKRMEVISEEERMQVLEAASVGSTIPVWIDDDPGATVARIGSKARLWKRRKGLKLLVIDYLQLIEPEDKRVVREQQVATISRQLKILAMQLEIPVVCLAQLNRQLENLADKRPRMSHLRESGSLEQDASCVMLLHRPEEYNASDRPGEVIVYLDKNRNGPTGIVTLQFDKPTMTFRDLARPMSYYGTEEFN